MAALARKSPDIDAMKPQPRAAMARPIDLVHLARQTLGDRALEVELLGMFDRQAEAIVNKINNPHADGAARAQRDPVHKLKGSARAIGATHVASAAEAYEAALEGGDAEAAREELARAVLEARQAIAELLG